MPRLDPSYEEMVAATICSYAGHEWEPAGGGLLICAVCLKEAWDDSIPPFSLYDPDEYEW